MSCWVGAARCLAWASIAIGVTLAGTLAPMGELIPSRLQLDDALHRSAVSISLSKRWEGRDYRFWVKLATSPDVARLPGDREIDCGGAEVGECVARAERSRATLERWRRENGAALSHYADLIDREGFDGTRPVGRFMDALPRHDAGVGLIRFARTLDALGAVEGRPAEALAGSMTRLRFLRGAHASSDDLVLRAIMQRMAVDELAFMVELSAYHPSVARSLMPALMGAVTPLRPEEKSADRWITREFAEAALWLDPANAADWRFEVCRAYLGLEAFFSLDGDAAIERRCGRWDVRLVATAAAVFTDRNQTLNLAYRELRRVGEIREEGSGITAVRGTAAASPAPTVRLKLPLAPQLHAWKGRLNQIWWGDYAILSFNVERPLDWLRTRAESTLTAIARQVQGFEFRPRNVAGRWVWEHHFEPEPLRAAVYRPRDLDRALALARLAIQLAVADIPSDGFAAAVAFAETIDPATGRAFAWDETRHQLHFTPLTPGFDATGRYGGVPGRIGFSI